MNTITNQLEVATKTLAIVMSQSTDMMNNILLHEYIYRGCLLTVFIALLCRLLWVKFSNPTLTKENITTYSIIFIITILSVVYNLYALLTTYFCPLSYLISYFKS